MRYFSYTYQVLLLCLVLYLAAVHADVSTVETRENFLIAEKYLSEYGYVNPDTSRKRSAEEREHELRDGIKRFQTFFGLKVTGVLDRATMQKLRQPRCGNPDPPINQSTRRKRYAIQGSRWRKRLIIWRLGNHGRSLRRSVVKEVIRRSTALWSKHAHINFREGTKGEHIDMWIKFATGHHGDNPFDGANGTVGHGFFPTMDFGIAGDIHLDDDENFVYNTSGGYDIMQVMVHEMGHALGLKHSRHKLSIMTPLLEYGTYKKELKLDPDDIAGIQRLYGKKPKPTAAPLKPCPRVFFTAVYHHDAYNLFVAITGNEQMYFIKHDGTIRSGPLRRTRYFPKFRLPDRIDAAFTTDKIRAGKNITVFFAEANYYLYEGFRFLSGPHSMHSRYEKDGVTKTPLEIVLPDWVHKVEAAFTWSNGDPYLFYGNWFWRYGFDEKRFRRGYPRKTNLVWKGFSYRIHTAFIMADGTRALMVDNKLFELEKRVKKVAVGFPVYVGKSRWLKCRNPR